MKHQMRVLWPLHNLFKHKLNNFKCSYHHNASNNGQRSVKIHCAVSLKPKVLTVWHMHNLTALQLDILSYRNIHSMALTSVLIKPPWLSELLLHTNPPSLNRPECQITHYLQRWSCQIPTSVLFSSQKIWLFPTASFVLSQFWIIKEDVRIR